MFLIVGLGNPEEKYFKTFHNMGYLAAGDAAGLLNAKFKKKECEASVAEGYLGGEKVIVARPLTYMNASGRAVKQLMARYKLSPSELVVIYDDYDLPKGHVRIRPSGSAGTHNGMRSVVQQLGTEDFPRIRIGVGGNKGSLVNHVIGAVPKEERVRLEEAAQAASDAALDIIRLGADRAMNLHNTKKESKKNGESKDEK